MFYRQRDIVEFNVELNDGGLLPVWGLIISDDTVLENPYNQIDVLRVSRDMTVFNPLHHRLLYDTYMESSFDTPSFVTTGFERLNVPNRRITRCINRMKSREFQKTLAWATTLIGHKWLFMTNPIKQS